MEVGVETRQKKDFDDSYIEVLGIWNDIKEYLDNTGVTEKKTYEWRCDWFFVKMTGSRTEEIWGFTGIDTDDDDEATLLYFADIS